MNTLVGRRCGVYNNRTTMVNTIAGQYVMGREVVYTILYNGGMVVTSDYNSGTIVVYTVLEK
jgi:hypothetical protein